MGHPDEMQAFNGQPIAQTLTLRAPFLVHPCAFLANCDWVWPRTCVAANGKKVAEFRLAQKTRSVPSEEIGKLGRAIKSARAEVVAVYRAKLTA
jgi:hypothetical protein